MEQKEPIIVLYDREEEYARLFSEYLKRQKELPWEIHTYTGIEGEDYQILVEADFLVNLFEDGSSRETAEKVRENIFKTKTGMKYLETLFLTERRS